MNESLGQKKYIRFNTKFAQINSFNKWSKIHKQILSIHPQFNRTSKQIRQRYLHHLDPTLNNNSLTLQEEQIIFKSHSEIGSKWKEIQKILPHKSEKSIKNFFYSTLRKSIRRVMKIFGAKNSTVQSRQLKPHVLNKLIQSANEHPEKRQSIYRLYELHKIKNSDCKETEIPQKDISIYRQIVDDIIYFNQLYSLNKKQGNRALQKKLINSKCLSGSLDKSIQKQTIHGLSILGDCQNLGSLQISQQVAQSEQFQKQKSISPVQVELLIAFCYNQKSDQCKMFQT